MEILGVHGFLLSLMRAGALWGSFQSHSKWPLGFVWLWCSHSHLCLDLYHLEWALSSARTMCEGIILLCNWCVCGQVCGSVYAFKYCREQLPLLSNVEVSLILKCMLLICCDIDRCIKMHAGKVSRWSNQLWLQFLSQAIFPITHFEKILYCVKKNMWSG